MNNVAESLKQHIWCVIIIAAILLLAIITLSFSDDVSLVSHLSLTSAVISIILAVIVIVYMYFQDHRSSQNITEMRQLIDEGYRTMTDKACLMADTAESMQSFLQTPAPDSATATPPLEIEAPFQFDISVYNSAGIVVLYAIAKCYESELSMSWDAISEAIYPEAKTMQLQCAYYGFGVISSLSAFLGRDALIWSHQKQEVKTLPDGFKDSIIAEAEKYSGKKSGIFLKRSVITIDAYFARP